MSGGNAVKKVFNIAKRSAFLRNSLLLPFYFFRFLIHAIQEKSGFIYRYYPGYHGSVLPSLREVARERDRIFRREIPVADGIDLREAAQLDLLKKLAPFYRDFSPAQFRAGESRYYCQNDMFGFNDAFILYCFLRHYKPRQIVEVGSGHSSALMIDVCEEFLPATELTFIDPYSTTISEVLRQSPKVEHSLIREEVQKVSLDRFRILDENDILFVDTSHSVKIGSG